MDVRITNGATVSRMWGTEPETEFLAAFQYESDAREFALSKLADDAKRDWFDSTYIVSNHGNGTVAVFRPKRPKAEAA